MNKALRNIIWLASYPKSGNTWVRIVLQNLFHQANEPANINELKQFPICSSLYLLDSLSGTNVSDLTQTEIDILRPKLYKRMAYEHNELVFLKVHDAWHKNIQGVPIFPAEVTKAVVYIIRNPLDISVSLAFHNNIAFDKAINIMNNDKHTFCGGSNKLYNQVRQFISSWSYHVRSWTTQSGLPLFVIKYESLLDDPIQVISDLTKYLHLSHPEDRIKQAIEFSSFSGLQTQEENDGFSEKPINARKFFRSGKTNDYNDYLSEDEIKKVLERNRDMMTSFGYSIP